MVLTTCIEMVFLKDPVDLDKLKSMDMFNVRELAEKGSLIVVIPTHIKKNKEKREYKVGFLNELYKKLFPGWSSLKIFTFVKDHYDIFIDQRQYQIDVKNYKKNKNTKFII